MAGVLLPLSHAYTYRTPFPPSPLGYTPKNETTQNSFPRLKYCAGSILPLHFIFFSINLSGFGCWTFFFLLLLLIFSSPNSFEIVFGENPFGFSSCPCISSHSHTCSLRLDIGKNKWPTYINTWYTHTHSSNTSLERNPRVFAGKEPKGAKAVKFGTKQVRFLRQESLPELTCFGLLVISVVSLIQKQSSLVEVI